MSMSAIRSRLRVTPWSRTVWPVRFATSGATSVFEYDAAGNQSLTYVLSIDNGFGGTSTQGTPDEGKYLFAVGSTKSGSAEGQMRMWPGSCPVPGDRRRRRTLKEHSMSAPTAARFVGQSIKRREDPRLLRVLVDDLGGPSELRDFLFGVFPVEVALAELQLLRREGGER